MDFKAIWRGLTGADKTPMREAAGGTVDADDDQWRPLSGDSGRDLSPMSQARMRQVAFWLWENNLIANRLIELPLAYLLAEGVELRGYTPEAQRLLHRFWLDPINNMALKLPKKVRELALFGEQCYPTFVNEIDGAVRLGYLDPAQIETVMVDPDNPEQPIGIVSMRDKKGVQRRYKIIVNGADTEIFGETAQRIRTTMDSGECFYFKVNDTSTGRRGRSDLLAAGDWLDAYDEFLFGEFDRSRFLRAFVWDVTMTGATPEQVAKRMMTISSPAPGSVRVHNEAETWAPLSPALNAGDSTQNATLFRNHILGGLTVPEHWFGGGGNVNRASGESMMEPTFKMFSMRQRQVKALLEEIGCYVLRREAMARGVRPEWDDKSLDCEAIFPELTAKDTSKYAAALQQAAAACVATVAQGLMTRETAVRVIAAVAGRLGVEVAADEELAKAEAEAGKQAENDTFFTGKKGSFEPKGAAGGA